MRLPDFLAPLPAPRGREGEWQRREEEELEGSRVRRAFLLACLLMCKCAQWFIGSMPCRVEKSFDRGRLQITFFLFSTSCPSPFPVSQFWFSLFIPLSVSHSLSLCHCGSLDYSVGLQLQGLASKLNPFFCPASMELKCL